MSDEILEEEEKIGAQLAVSHQVQPIDDAADLESRRRIFQRRNRKAGFEVILETQAIRLRNRGCPPALIEQLKTLWPDLIEQLMMKILGDYLAALPVIPRAMMPLNEQIMLVRNGHLTGFTNLDINQVADIIKVSEKPYYLVSVEDGRGAVLLPPGQSGGSFQDRSALLATEIMALGLHSPNAFLSRKLAAALSPYTVSEPIGGKVAALGLNAFRPVLDWTWANLGLDNVGVPSCAQRFSPRRD